MLRLPSTALLAGQEFLGLLLTVLPFFVLGAVTGAALQTFVSRRWSERLFGGRGLRALVSAVTAGALLPGCSCATMPMASGLRGTAAPRLGTLAAFIFVSPLLGPITVALTWGMLGWEITAARVVASLTGSLLLGVLINRFEPWFARDAPPVGVAAACGAVCCDPLPAGAGQGEGARGREAGGARFWPSLRTILRSVTPFFLLGMLIAAVLAALVPEDAIPKLLGGSAGVWAYMLAAIAGIPLYVCEGEEVPITYALLTLGLGQGPALTFLLGSVGTCVPTILKSRGIIGRRATVFYVAYRFAFAVGAGLLFQATGGPWPRP